MAFYTAAVTGQELARTPITLPMQTPGTIPVAVAARHVPMLIGSEGIG